MTDSLLRQRYIESGLIRPNTKELDPIQLNPGAIVFRINPTAYEVQLARGIDAMYAACRKVWDRYMLGGSKCSH